MAHSKKGGKHSSDSNSDSEEEVRNDPNFLLEENARLNELLDNRDDVLRKTIKEKREFRSLLGDAKDKVAELESLLVDARNEIAALKSAHVMSDEIDCCDCSVFLVDLTALKEKHASTLEELDVVRIECDELKSRPTLLGTCTSCIVLHARLDESHTRIDTLEAALKAPLPT